jgi:hypothetical protein
VNQLTEEASLVQEFLAESDDFLVLDPAGRMANLQTAKVPAARKASA